MINSKPNNSKYQQGNYIPVNKDKVIKLNSQGGIFYRSSWEKRFQTYLDHSEHVIKWGAECLSVPYQMKHFNSGDLAVKNHTYYPDFYYETRINGVLKQVVVEIKPHNEYLDVIMLQEGKFDVPQKITTKGLSNLEYKFKMAQRNLSKWETMIKWCDKMGYEFIIITEKTLNNYIKS